MILGGDGYLGWPTAMYFSARGHKVTVVDSGFKRTLCHSLGLSYLYEVPTLIERARLWHEVSGKEIKVVIGNLADPEVMRSLFKGEYKYDFSINNAQNGMPDTIIHFAEQPSAPYSMMDYKTSNQTISNNLLVTNNLMFAVKDYCRNAHIIKLGTMGEYGTPDIDIEEGWLDIEHKGRKGRFLFPRQAGSIYHTSKIMDTDLLWFGVRTWKLKVTDLMQGPVYGIVTEESITEPGLYTTFNYDEIFGTILNRFIAQACVGHPLTVYGKGGQTRGYLNIKDTLQCVYKAGENPPKPGNMNIFNQIMETFSASELAAKVKSVGDSLGFEVKIENIENPRIEAENHYYNPTYQGLMELGVTPHFLTNEVMQELFALVSEHKDNIKREIIFQGVKW